MSDYENEAETPSKPSHEGKNIVYIGQETFQNDPQDGEEVDFSGSGKIVTKEDGSKCLEVTEIEGVPVSGGQESGEDANLKRLDEVKGLIRGQISAGNDSGEGEA